MNQHTFNTFNYILNVGIQFNFKFSCDTNGINEGAAMWLVHFIIKMKVFSALYKLQALKRMTRIGVTCTKKITTITMYLHENNKKILVSARNCQPSWLGILSNVTRKASRKTPWKSFYKHGQQRKIKPKPLVKFTVINGKSDCVIRHEDIFLSTTFRGWAKRIGHRWGVSYDTFVIIQFLSLWIKYTSMNQPVRVIGNVLW